MIGTNFRDKELLHVVEQLLHFSPANKWLPGREAFGFPSSSPDKVVRSEYKNVGQVLLLYLV